MLFRSDNFKPVVAKLKLEVKSVPGLTREMRADPKMPWTHPSVIKSVFSPDSLKNLRNTEAVEIGPNHLISARVTQHHPSMQIPLEEIKPMIVQAVLVQKALDLAKTTGQSKLQEWKKSPQTADLQSPVVIGREQSLNLPPNLVEEAMRSSITQLPVLIGVDLGSKGYGIVKVNKIIEANPQAKSVQMKERFNKTWDTAENLAYYTYLKGLLKASVKEPAPTDNKLIK